MPGQQQSASGGSYDPNVDPGDVNPPAIFEPSMALCISGAPEVWVTASGGTDWGGAIVSISFDGTNFSVIGHITAPALQGGLTAALPYHGDPDNSGTLSIDLTASAGIMPTSATHADADAFRTLAYVCSNFSTVAPNDGELIAYGAVAATGTYTSDLAYLRRGLYGTPDMGHAITSFFTRIDLGEIGKALNSIIVYKLPPQYIGATLYLKFQSFNVFGRALQDIASVVEYTYVPSGQGYGYSAGVPSTPTGLAGYARGASGSGYNTLNWTANPSGDAVQYYTVLRRLSGFGSYTAIGTSSGTSYNDNSAATGITYDYELTATNVSGTSAAAGPVTVTTN
ncbi:MAG TPA: hypothetical protein VHT03_01615 [Rhizomicrobium sp.]|jgi:hypothetical protein|nr:hypothetical protein [Rhizomicrobium sp.]